MADQDGRCVKSRILYNILDVLIGSRQLIATRREVALTCEQLENGASARWLETFKTGSGTEGVIMMGSDIDMMFIDKRIRVMFPGQEYEIPPDSTILYARNTNCRPGYVYLELAKLGQSNNDFLESIVAVKDKHFISSTIFNRSKTQTASRGLQQIVESHGPASTLRNRDTSYGTDVDMAYSFPCKTWPEEANEWVSRPRLYGWPSEVLRREIVQGGCHFVSVGDRTSEECFLQWRISFTKAERKLVHSFSHIQFLVYSLLKYLLKQISSMLEEKTGDEDILSSYMMKTIMFYALENTTHSFWQEQNIFLCFMFCFKILISWVKTGYCPNYFIKHNNMFLGKVNGENQQKLLCYLTQLYSMKWNCLSVGTAIRPSLGESIRRILHGSDHLKPPPNFCEFDTDMLVFQNTFCYMAYSPKLSVLFNFLSKSKSDIEEFIMYFHTMNALASRGMNMFGKHAAVRGNKERYAILRKSKAFLEPQASVCVSPGLLVLATFYYRTGNYKKALEICEHVSTFCKPGFIPLDSMFGNMDKYERFCLGQKFTFLKKCQEACGSVVYYRKPALEFCPSLLHPELANDCLRIPPRSYAEFLSFLCYHELGDHKRCDTTLAQLETLKYDRAEGGRVYWITHNLLGICYELAGDTGRATREYQYSLGSSKFDQRRNPALLRLERLQRFR